MTSKLVVFFFALAFVDASEDSAARTVLKGLIDATFVQSDLTDAGRNTIATLLENCDVSATPLNRVLDDAVAAANKCQESVVDKSEELVITAADGARFKNCTFATRDVYVKHGGINFLAQPSLSDADLHTLKMCADGTDMHLGEAFYVVLNRYTPCVLPHMTAGDQSALRDALTSSTIFVGEQRQASLRQICNSLSSFEDLNKVVARFTTGSVASFIDSITDASA